MFRFNKKYFFLAIGLFLIEVLIAIFLNDKIIRPYVGDLLVVILLYSVVRSSLKVSVLTAAIGVLLFSYMAETMQYLKLVELLGLQKSRLANIIIGNTFGWIDIVAYTTGIILVILLERIAYNREYKVLKAVERL